MSVEQDIARHYTSGTIAERILGALSAAGKDLSALTADDLAPVDEFHIGGLQATMDFAEQLGLRADMHLLDVGCGIGGPARHLASAYGCRVTGIDLTEEFVKTAATLTARVGLGDKVDFKQTSAAAMPFASGTFDGALLLHVGMNIPDKAKMFAEVRRVLKPDGWFGVFDVMRQRDGDLVFPVPWSTRAETSFVETPEAYKKALAGAGFTVVKERNRLDFAVDFFRKARARMAESGPPPLGMHVIMGGGFAEKAANITKLLEAGIVAPVEMICRAG